MRCFLKRERYTTNLVPITITGRAPSVNSSFHHVESWNFNTTAVGDTFEHRYSIPQHGVFGMGDINTAGRDEYQQHIRDIASTDDVRDETGGHLEEPESANLEAPEDAAVVNRNAPLTPIPASPLPTPGISQEPAKLLLPPSALPLGEGVASELAASPQSLGTSPQSANRGGTSGSSRASSPVPDTPPPPGGFWKRLAKGGGKGSGKASKREKMAEAMSGLLERSTSRSSVSSKCCEHFLLEIILMANTQREQSSRLMGSQI